MRVSRWLATVLLAVVAGTGSLAQPAAAAAWQPWENLGVFPDPYPGKAGVATRDGGLVDVFVTTGDIIQTSIVYHRTWSSGAGWSERRYLPGALADGHVGSVSAVGRPGNRLSVVVADGPTIYHQAYDGSWRGWESLGQPGFLGRPAVSSRPNGTVDVWVRGTKQDVLHRAWTPAGGWGSWGSVGGVTTGAPAAAGGSDGSVWVAARGTDGNLYHRVWSPSTGQWSAWFNTGSPPGGTTVVGSPGIDVRPNGLVDLYAMAAEDGPIYHRYRSAAGTWSAWGSLQGGDLVEGPNAVARSNGALDVVVRKRDGTVWHRAWA